MQVATVASPLTKTFSWKATITGFIKFASKEAIPRAIPIVFRERPLAVAGGLWAGYFSRNQSCHGLAVRRGPWIAGAKARGRIRCAAADRAGARAFDWNHHRRGPHGAYEPAASHPENCRRRDPLCLRVVSTLAFASSELGGDASRLRRFDALVFRNGVSARRRIDARSVFSTIAGCGRAASPRNSPNARVGIREF